MPSYCGHGLRQIATRVLHVIEQPPRDERRAGEQQQPDHQVARPLGRHPHHHDEQGEEQQRRAEVLLGDHHDHGEAPGERDRQQVAQLGEVERPDPPASGGDQLAVIGEVAGEEQRQGDLGELTGLEVDRSEADPDPRPALGVADAGHERQQQQRRADGEEAPLVAGQIAGALDDDQRGDVGDDGHERPRRLQSGRRVR